MAAAAATGEAVAVEEVAADLTDLEVCTHMFSVLRSICLC
jgi:hypothetical protein